MKLRFIISIFLLISAYASGQSKKKQIELLNGKVDSLTTVNTKLQDSLQFEALMIKEANNDIKSAELRLSQLQKQFDEISKDNSDLRSVISTLKNEIQRITAGQDSLVKFYEESKILDDFIIATNSVGPYVIGNSFPEVDGIESIRKEETRWTPDEPSQYEVVYYDVFLGKEKLMEVYINSYSEIERISILSPKLQTSNGIRVGSTIDDFIRVHYNYRLLYNYLCGWYWIDTRDDGFELLYRLDEDDLLNPRIDAVITAFDTSDWRPKSEIVIIECGVKMGTHIVLD